VYGTPEEREHERLRVSQEWEKIEHDKAKGIKDRQIWDNHIDRMKRMALSVKCPNKCERRSRHLELAGLTSASRMFQESAAALRGETEGPVDPQKDLLLDNLHKFTGFVCELEKYQSRRVGEIWTRDGGQRVTKRPDGIIIPYIAPKAARGRKAGDPKSSIHNKQSARKNVKRFNLSDLNAMRGDNGFESAHFSKSMSDLVKEVQRLLQRLEDHPNCVLPNDLATDEEANKKFRKYNKAVCDAEESAKKYGKRGLKKTGKKSDAESDRTFWLATALLFDDVSQEFTALRDAALKEDK